MDDPRPGLPPTGPFPPSSRPPFEPQPSPSPVPAPRPPRPSFFAKNRTWLNVVLLIATALSTYFVGLGWSVSYIYSDVVARDPSFTPGAEAMRDPRVLWLSAFYTVALLVILLAHEMGHYLTCRRYGLDATLPFFVPAPTLIGTFGAFIKIRSPIRSKRQLFDIGAAGPLAGFVLSVPALFYGLAVSKPTPPLTGEGVISFGEPLLIKLIGLLVLPAIPEGYDIVLHPVAFAGWVGLLVTALNLFPAGQLDGGHIAYSIFGRRTRMVSRAVVILFTVFAVVFWLGWLIWAFIIGIIGTKHPPLWDEDRPLPLGRKVLAAAILVIFILSFIPDPVKGYSGLDFIRQWLG